MPLNPSNLSASTIVAPPLPVAGRGVQEVLNLLATSGAIGAGNVNLISLEPIEQRLGHRWPQKREQVWDQVESFLKRQFRPEDLIVRLDELNVLIFQPGKERIAAQSLCVRACSDLMKFFLGESPITSVRIKMVQGMEQDALVCAPLPMQRLASMMLTSRPGLGKPERVGSTPVLTRLGRNLTVVLSIDALWNLQPAPRIIGHYAEATLMDGDSGQKLTTAEYRQLQAGDFVDIDLAVFRDALAMRAASPRLAGGLIIPVSYVTLANSSTRYQLLQEVQRIAPTERKSFGWEITDLETGIPPGRLSEMVSIARQNCRGVMCRMPLTVPNAGKVRSAGATMSVGPPGDHAPYDELALFRMEAVATSAIKTVRSLLLHRVPANLVPVATFIGATHCTMAAEK